MLQARAQGLVARTRSAKLHWVSSLACETLGGLHSATTQDGAAERFAASESPWAGFRQGIGGLSVGTVYYWIQCL